MINQYMIDKELGEGSFATVYQCIDTKSNIKYALKKMNKKDLKRKNAYDHVLEELKVLKTLEHPNVIYLHEIIDDPNKDSIYLVTEYLSNGSLGDKVKSINNSYKLKCQNEGTNPKKIGLKN